MENCLNNADIYYKTIEEYKIDILHIIEHMISKNERMAFAVVAEKAGITPFVIRQYPELKKYILQKMIYLKEIQSIHQKIDRAVISLLKANKNITFLSIINKCSFDSEIIYQNHHIKDKIRRVLTENKQ